MKKIVITENQAKKLVSGLIGEQDNKVTKYRIAGLDVVKKDNGMYYVNDPSSGNLEKLPNFSETEIIIHPNDLTFGLENDAITQYAKDLARNVRENNQKPNNQKPRGLGFEIIVWDDIKYNKPVWYFINVLANEGAIPVNADTLKNIKQKDGTVIKLGVTRTNDYVLSATPLLIGEQSVEGGSVEGSKLYYCLTYSDDTKGIVNTKEPVDINQYVGKQISNGKTVKSGTGPYSTKEEANVDCSKPSLPDIIPFGNFFENNVSTIKLSPGSDFVKKLKEFFDAGGKLKKITIKASASKVPAGFVENDPKQGVWSGATQYDTVATGDNNDNTGNLQLTKARAYNLYVALITMFPQLKSVPHELIALGSVGDPYVKGTNKPDAANYANFRRVDLYLDK